MFIKTAKHFRVLPLLIAISAILTFSSMLYASDDASDQESINTLFSSGIEHSGGYGAFEMKFNPTSDFGLLL
jgi:hypothetical protein